MSTTTPPLRTGRALIVSITDQTVHGENDGGLGALVAELLLPLAQQDPGRAEELLARYHASVGGPAPDPGS